MQRNDSSEENKTYRKEDLEKQGKKLLQEIDFDLRKVNDSLEHFTTLEAHYSQIKETTDVKVKARLLQKYQELFDEYMILLNIAKEAYEILKKEELLLIFISLNPGVAAAKNLLENILSTEYKLDDLDLSREVLETLSAKNLGEVLKHLKFDLIKIRNTEHAIQLLTTPKNFLKAVSELPGVIVIDFLEFYSQSKQYENLRRKFKADPTKLSPSEILCIALTTKNIYELHSSDLDKVIDELSKDYTKKNFVEKLRLMRDIIKLHEQPKLAEDKKFMLELSTRFDKRSGGEMYINLQGAKVLPDGKFFAGANIKGARLPDHAEDKGMTPSNSLIFVSNMAIHDPDMMTRQLNQLEKMLGNQSDTNATRKWRLMTLDQCFEALLKVAQSNTMMMGNPYTDNVFKADNVKLARLIKNIEIVLNHPFTKENSTDNKFDVKGSLFRLVGSSSDTRPVHKKLKDLKKALEGELDKRQEKKGSKQVESVFGRKI